MPFEAQKGMTRWVMLGFILAFLMLPSITFSVKANPETIVVPDDYSTIQSAIDAAPEGAVIYVKSGVYHENLRVNKSVSLVGESYDSTVIDGNASEGYRAPCRITSDNVSVSGFTLRDSWDGIQLGEVSGCNISGNRMINNHYGIMLSSASGNSIIGNIVDSAELGYGIYLLRSSNNLVKGNLITSSAEGIAVIDDLFKPTDIITSKNNRILENTIANCTDKAMWFKFTKENLMVGNTITNSAIGLAIIFTDNNTIYQNNFVDNAQQVAGGLEPIFSGGSGTRYSTCVWDNSQEGNYWSNYNGTDADNDGIGDTPYVINEANADNFPLMDPVATQEITLPPEANADYPSPTPSVTTPVSSSPTPTNTPPTTEPLPIGQIIAVSASATVALFGFWLYFKKPKR
jgi:nitrous oxidase accessory protein